MIRVLVYLLVLLMASPSWAAITYVGGQAGTSAGQAGNLDINFALTGGSDSTPQAGDLVLITFCVAGTGDLATIIEEPGGTDYDLLGTESYFSDTYDINRRTAARVMPGTPDTAFRLDNGAGNIADAMGYDVHVYRGQHATYLEQAVQQGTAGNTSVVNPGSITPTTSGTLVYVAGCGALASTRQGVYTSSDLSNFLSSAQDDTNAVNIGVGHFSWTSGAFSPATFGAGGTDNIEHSYSWMIVALAPAESVAVCRGALMLVGAGGC